MISASELRKGNFVTLAHRVMYVSEIWGDKMTLIEERPSTCALDVPTDEWVGYNTEGLAPIELADEWLDNFGIQLWQIHDPEEINPFVGFKLSENLFLQKNYCRDASGRYDGYLLVIKTGSVFRAVWDCQPVKTVHRLQNIVFDLIGQELTLIESL